MEIRQLEYFLMVSQLNSFTRAAERLFVSQPAVTNSVRNLEDELGIQLFDRNQKQALLTAEGKIFRAHVEQLMTGISNTLEEIHAIKNLSGGVLHIGLNILGGVRPNVLLLKNFMESYPNIKIKIEDGSTKILQEMLIENKLDLAILWQEKEKPVFSYKTVAEQELVVCCGRQHKFRRKNILRVEDLSGEFFILPKDKEYLKVFGENFLQEIKISVETNQIQTIKSFVAADCGISILPECLADSDDNLTTIPFDPPIILNLMLVCKKNRQLSHAAVAFAETIQKGADNKND